MNCKIRRPCWKPHLLQAVSTIFCIVTRWVECQRGMISRKEEISHIPYCVYNLLYRYRALHLPLWTHYHWIISWYLYESAVGRYTFKLSAANGQRCVMHEIGRNSLRQRSFTIHSNSLLLIRNSVQSFSAIVERNSFVNRAIFSHWLTLQTDINKTLREMQILCTHVGLGGGGILAKCGSFGKKSGFLGGTGHYLTQEQQACLQFGLISIWWLIWLERCLWSCKSRFIHFVRSKSVMRATYVVGGMSILEPRGNREAGHQRRGDWFWRKRLKSFECLMKIYHMFQKANRTKIAGLQPVPVRRRYNSGRSIQVTERITSVSSTNHFELEEYAWIYYSEQAVTLTRNHEQSKIISFNLYLVFAAVSVYHEICVIGSGSQCMQIFKTRSLIVLKIQIPAP